MDVDALIARLSEDPSTALPFVGSGLVRPAGAPSTEELAVELARRTACTTDLERPSLADVCITAAEAVGVDEVREHVAEIFSGLRLRSTPALTAICGTPSRRIVTTNYDDGIERAAQRRGLLPVRLSPRDPRILQPPPLGHLHVIHLHGHTGEASSIVLPGRTTNELSDDKVFTTFVSAIMAASTVVYLGFSLGSAEGHLRDIIRWIGTAVDNPHPQYLVLPDGDVTGRADDLLTIRSYGSVTLVPYAPDATHSEVERVALSLAPRSDAADGALTWLQPVVVRAEPGDNEDRLRHRVTSFDLLGDASSLADVEDLLSGPAHLVIAGPGMGKTTLVDHLPGFDDARLVARGRLTDFSPAADEDQPEAGVASLLWTLAGDTRLPVRDLRSSGGLLLLDGLDEVDTGRRAAAVEAVLAAAAAWPNHTWVVTSRPTAAADALAEGGFAVTRILPSRRWARRYLETRSVPELRIEHALLDGFGLGDLLAVPFFAARLADRLLEGLDGAVTPLEVLVDEQYATVEREAIRHQHDVDDLRAWMRSLAIALEIGGRTSVPISELSAVPGPAGLRSVNARKALADVSLLADDEHHASFPAKPLQEGLCADAILRSPDPVAVMRRVAVATVHGVERWRDDIDMTIDLVFEHATPAARRDLRRMDQVRWARTVVTRGNATDAEEAFDVLWGARSHPPTWTGDAGLRSAGQALEAIGRKWPAILDARRDALVRASACDDPATRLRALAVLGTAAGSDPPDPWLLPRLADEVPAVVRQAAEVAGRLRTGSVTEALFGLLDDPERRTMAFALRALVEILPAAELPELAARIRWSDGLRPVRERLDERLDLDAGLAFLARAGGIDHVGAWLLSRLIVTASPGAWTEDRVAQVLTICAHPAGADVDADHVATVLAHRPELVLDHLRPHALPGSTWGPANLLRPLGRLDPSILAGTEFASLRDSIAAADADWRLGQEPRDPDADLATVAARLDAEGLDLEPRAVDWAVSLDRLGSAHRELLQRLMEHWWPDDGSWTNPGLPSDTAEVALHVGIALGAPLSPARWKDLVAALLGARRPGPLEFQRDQVVWWLSSIADERHDALIAARLADATDGEAISLLVTLGRRSGRRDEFLRAAARQLAHLDPELPRWLHAAGFLAEQGAGSSVQELLELDLPDAVRTGVDAALARSGDDDAQRRVVLNIAAALRRGEVPVRPQWHSRESPARAQTTDASAGLIDALRELADEAIAREAPELRSFALGQLVTADPRAVLPSYEALDVAHGADDAWLAHAVERTARRVATDEILRWLPSDVTSLAAWFEAECLPSSEPQV